MPRAPDPELRRWWQRLISSYDSSGLSIAAFCKQRDVSAASFYAWRRKLLTEVAIFARRYGGQFRVSARHRSRQPFSTISSRRLVKSRTKWEFTTSPTVCIASEPNFTGSPIRSCDWQLPLETNCGDPLEDAIPREK